MLTNQRPFRRVIKRNYQNNLRNQMQTKTTVDGDSKEHKHEYDTQYESLIENNNTFWDRYSANKMNDNTRRFIISLLKKNPNKRPTIEKIQRSKWYNDYLYDKPHVLRYQVLSLFRNLKSQHFNEKFDIKNKQAQSKKDTLLASHISNILDVDTKLQFNGVVQFLPLTQNENGNDIYTTVDWRVVYHTVSKFIKENFGNMSDDNQNDDKKSDTNENQFG